MLKRGLKPKNVGKKEKENQKMDKLEQAMKAQITNIMTSEIEQLEGELTEAKLKFAESTLDESDWQCRYDRKMLCKTLEAQIFMLNKMVREIAGLTSAPALMNA
jgi:hypothetical protein